MLKYGKNIHFDPKKLDRLNVDYQTSELIPEGSTVLDIGCATGFLGEYLIEKKGCIVDGVDLGHEEAREARKKLRRVYEGDIEEKKTLQLVTGTYDVVNASALIEHLKDPWAALALWKKFLKKNGTLVVSTSNIAHFSMRKNLLTGKFIYEKYGILDNTHLRFFTYDTFQKLVTSAGYTIDEVRIDPVGGGYPKISKFLSRWFPNIFAYQMIIKAHR